MTTNYRLINIASIVILAVLIYGFYVGYFLTINKWLTLTLVLVLIFGICTTLSPAPWIYNINYTNNFVQFTNLSIFPFLNKKIDLESVKSIVVKSGMMDSSIPFRKIGYAPYPIKIVHFKFLFHNNKIKDLYMIESFLFYKLNENFIKEIQLRGIDVKREYSEYPMGFNLLMNIWFVFVCLIFTPGLLILIGS